MATYKRLTSLIPFLVMNPGEFWFVLCNGVESIEIKGKPNPVISMSIYYSGKISESGGLPPADKMIEQLKNEPTPVYTGQNKSLMDAMFPADDPKFGAGKYFLIAYGGQKSIAGGKKFNNWEIYEVER